MPNIPDELLASHLSGAAPLSSLPLVTAWDRDKFNLLLNSRGISRRTHLWVPSFGYVSKTDPTFWKSIHDRYLAGESFVSLCSFLGICPESLYAIFRRNSLPVRTRQETSVAVTKTNLARYGTPCALQAPAAREKSRQTSLQKYGVPVPLQSPQHRAKIKAVNLLKHGTIDPGNSPVSRQKATKKFLDRKLTHLLTLLPTLGYSFEDDYQGSCGLHPDGHRFGRHYKVRHTLCGHQFTFSFNSNTTPHCPSCFPPGAYQSRLETDLLSFIRSLGFDAAPKRHFIPMPSGGFSDIDIFVPALSIGFEVNGLYFHSLNGRDNVSARTPLYHQQKTQGALSRGIRLYHIWEYSPLPIIHSMIRNLLHLPLVRTSARKTTLSLLSQEESATFFDQNHLHSSVPSLFSLGLRSSSGTLLQAISFRRTSPSTTLEIARSATLLNHQVQGGFSKLLSAFPHTLYPQVTSILSYADADFTPDPLRSVYSRCGFSYEGDSGPILRYTDFSSVWDRRSLQKHKLRTLFPGIFSPFLTEQQILSLKNIYPFYNAGNHKFLLSLTS